MTGKLIKYEFRSIIKQIGIVWVALPVTALLFSFSDWIISGNELMPERSGIFGDILLMVTSFLYGGIFMAMAAVTCFIVIMRFYKGLLRDEGYLMHTLPVKTWQLITAKGIVAACVVLGSIIVAIFSIFMLNVIGGFADIGEMLAQLGQLYGQYPLAILYTLEILVLVIVSVIKSIYQVYAAMSIGQLSAKHKIAFSVLAYIAIGAVIMIVFTLFVTLLGSNMMVNVMEWIADGLNQMEVEQGIQLLALLYFLSQAVQVVIFHVVSERILYKRLNLE